MGPRWEEADQAEARRRGWSVDMDALAIRSEGGRYPSDAAAQAAVALDAFAAASPVAIKAWTYLAHATAREPGPGGGPRFRLCLVSDDNVAYFTSDPIEPRMGQGWDKRVDYDNADPPWGFSQRDGTVRALAFDGPFLARAVLLARCDSFGLTADGINAGECPWVATHNGAEWAAALATGTTLERFVEVVESLGGTVTPRESR